MTVEKRYSIGLPEKNIGIRTAAQSNNENGITNSMTGMKASMNYLKKSNQNTNKDVIGTGTEGTTGQDVIKATTLSPLGESFNYETFARIEQLLESSKLWLNEAYTSRRSTDGITPGGAGALGGGKGVDKVHHADQLNAQRSAATTITNEKIDNQQANQVKAARIEPQITTRGQTIGLTQTATNINSATKQATNQRAQEKWEQQQQQG